MYLSYSGWKKFISCHLAYYLSYIRRLPTPGVDDRLGSVFGSVLGRLFELFYNRQLYRAPQPQGAVDALVEETVDAILEEETTTTSSWRVAGVLLWKGDGEGQNPRGLYVNRRELEADVRDAVARGFRTIRHYRLLGQGARAEVALDANMHGHKLGGRADFIMRRVKPLDDLIILDGKGSKYRDAYADVRQLFWYSMLYRHHNKALPDQVGFVFWRFDPPNSIDMVPVTAEAIDRVEADVLKDIGLIQDLGARVTAKTPLEEVRRTFLPIVDTKASKEDREQACRFCPYATDEICPGGAKVVQELNERRRPV